MKLQPVNSIEINDGFSFDYFLIVNEMKFKIKGAANVTVTFWFGFSDYAPTNEREGVPVKTVKFLYLAILYVRHSQNLLSVVLNYYLPTSQCAMQLLKQMFFFL